MINSEKMARLYAEIVFNLRVLTMDKKCVVCNLDFVWEYGSKYYWYCVNNKQILIYILSVVFGLLLIPTCVDVKELELFLKKFCLIVSLMDVGYIMLWILIGAYIVQLILWIKNKVNSRKNEKEDG